MRLTLSALILTMLAAIIYLVVERQSTRVAETPFTEQRPTAGSQPPTVNSPRAAVPHLVRQLIDPTKHLDEQIEAIRNLPSDLTENEFQALIDLLHQPATGGVAPHTWSTLQNEIMEVLRNTRFQLPGYAPAMAALLQDKEADPIMRDYAAQHLTIYLADRAPLPPQEGTADLQLPTSNPVLSQEQTDQSLNALIKTLDGQRESQHQVTGTTLMALCDLNSKRPHLLEFHRPALTDSVTSLLNMKRPVTLSNRISAIQAAGRLNLPDLLPAIRTFAGADTTNASIKLSSIAALGYYADPTDQPFLEKLAQGQSRLRFAAQTALKNYQ